MVAFEIEYEDGATQHFKGAPPVTIGRGEDCDLRIRAWRVARHHATVVQRRAGLFIDDHGALTGTFVNNKRVAEYGPLQSSDAIVIGPCRIHVQPPSTRSASPVPITGAGNSTEVATPSATGVAGITGSLEPPDDFSQPASVSETEPAMGAWQADKAASSTRHEADILRARHRQRLHAALLDALNLRRRDIATLTDDDLRKEAGERLAEIVAADTMLPPDLDRAQLCQEVIDEAVGLGPLEPLLADPDITEIMVNHHDEIFIEVQGRLQRHPVGFSSEQAVLGVIERIVSPIGRRIDESSPMVDARLRDGSRVNAIIPPLALRGASLTIRKFPARRLSMTDLLSVGALDAPMKRFLEACVVQRKNIIVSGGTGSGKTTLLNILSNCIPAGERIITIEDAAELQLAHEHRVALEARPSNLEGRGAVTIRDLVRNALRMRPDRIVVGECRGGEAFDMLAAMNTGHEGSLTTLHANSPRDALGRLETMILMAGMDLPLTAVREHVASGIDVIVQQARLPSGHRVITSIVQITGQESGRIQLQELFCYCAEDGEAMFVGCGLIPDNFDMNMAGLAMDMFAQRNPVVRAAVGWQQSGAAE